MGNNLNSRPRNQIHDILLIHLYNVTRIIVYRSFHYFINRYDFFFLFFEEKFIYYNYSTISCFKYRDLHLSRGNDKNRTLLV